MISRLRERIATPYIRQAAALVQNWLAPTLLRRRAFRAAFFASLFASLYWGIVASDRFVSEAHVIVQQTDSGRTPGIDLTSVLTAAAGTGRVDQLHLRDFLLSVDMLERLDATLNLRQHYSDSRRDFLSRLWGADRALEWFHRHYLSRVSIEFDDYASVLVIKAQAYDPETAHAITSFLVQEGERYMNEMAHRLAQEQVVFLETQVAELGAKDLQARQAILTFQNQKGLVSPQAAAENLASVISKLEAQVSELKARRTALLGYLSPSAPGIVEINLQIEGIEQQVLREQLRLASPNGGKSLNRAVEEFQRLQLAAELTQSVYKTALVALEKGRVEAVRNLKKVSVLQTPTKPQYPLEPRRWYNLMVFVLAAVLLAGVVHLLAAIIRDHRD